MGIESRRLFERSGFGFGVRFGVEEAGSVTVEVETRGMWLFEESGSVGCAELCCEVMCEGVCGVSVGIKCEVMRERL